MDAVSELARVGVLEDTGRMISPEEADFLPEAVRKRVAQDEKGAYFILAEGTEDGLEEVVLTQRDIRELQLAKAAIRAGIQVLLEQAGLTYHDIDEVLLAGAFGSYINKASALGIGMLPPVSSEIILSVGNAAGTGARKMLVSEAVREQTKRIAREVEHLELSTRSDFQDHFVNFLSFELEA